MNSLINSNLPKPLYFLLLLMLTGCNMLDLTEDNRQNITHQFASARLAPNELSHQQIFDGQADSRFVQPPSKNLFGDSASIYWYKTHLPTELLHQGEYLLEIPYPLLDKVNVWFRTSEKQVFHYRAGADYSFSTRAISDPSFAFPIPVSDKDIDVVISVNTSSLLTVSILLWEKSDWLESQLLSKMWYGFLFGSMAILVLYNLFLSIALKDVSYVYYILYLLSINLMNAISAGYTEEFLWSETGGVGTRILLTMAAATTVFGILFINRFLDVGHYFPRLWKLSVVIIALVMLPAAIELMGLVNEGIFMSAIIATILLISNVAILYYLGISIACYRRGVKQARFVMLAITSLIVGYYGFQVFLFQGAEPNVFITHMLEAGTLTEGLLLSLALADRINLLTQKVELADKQAMQAQSIFSKKLIRNEEMDRERFSSTLHDSIGHGLLVLKQNLENIARQCGKKKSDRKDSQHDIHQQAKYCAEILNDVRLMSHDLHPHILSRLGLKAAIESTIERALSGTNIQWQADIDDSPDGMDVEREITLYRVIQESLNNIIKHAQATEVIVSLQMDKAGVQVNIKDDGIGFDAQEVGGSGLGLNTMRGRLQLFGGRLEIKSSKGFGTHLMISMPC